LTLFEVKNEEISDRFLIRFWEPWCLFLRWLLRIGARFLSKNLKSPGTPKVTKKKHEIDNFASKKPFFEVKNETVSDKFWSHFLGQYTGYNRRLLRALYPELAKKSQKIKHKKSENVKTQKKTTFFCGYTFWSILRSILATPILKKLSLKTVKETWKRDPKWHQKWTQKWHPISQVLTQKWVFWMKFLQVPFSIWDVGFWRKVGLLPLRRWSQPPSVWLVFRLICCVCDIDYTHTRTQSNGLYVGARTKKVADVSLLNSPHSKLWGTVK